MQRVLDIIYRSLLCDNEIVVDMADAEQADRRVPAPFAMILKQGPVGLLGTRPFCVPHFFDLGNSFHSASMNFPHFQLADSSSWREGMGDQGNKRAVLEQGPVSPT